MLCPTGRGFDSFGSACKSTTEASQPVSRGGEAMHVLANGLSVPETRAGASQLLIISTSPRHEKVFHPALSLSVFERVGQVASTGSLSVGHSLQPCTFIQILAYTLCRLLEERTI
jgi:hypothetical protein